MKIFVISTGGTIEKTYNEYEGTVENVESLIEGTILKKLRLPDTEIVVEKLMAKDSRDMTDSDRELICSRINELQSNKNPIIVVHGTDTMTDTAEYCYQRITTPVAPIIFTGAMKPAELSNSDAIQNFTEALFACRLAEPGFYISFHSHLHKVPNVQKNYKTLTFEKKN